MKWLLFFFLFSFPLVNALALSPTFLDYGEVKLGEEVYREVMVVNNYEEPLLFRISGIYNEEVYLLSEEKKVFSIPLEVVDKENGKYEDELVVEEIYGNNLVNAISIPVVYRVSGGDYTNESINFGSEKGVPYLAIASGVILLGLGTLGYFRRKNGKN